MAMNEEVFLKAVKLIHEDLQMISGQIKTLHEDVQVMKRASDRIDGNTLSVFNYMASEDVKKLMKNVDAIHAYASSLMREKHWNEDN